MPWGSSKSSKAEEQPASMEPPPTDDASLEDATLEIDRQPSATKSTRSVGDAPGIAASRPALAG